MKESSKLLSRRQFLTETSAAGFLVATVPVAQATAGTMPGGDPAPQGMVRLRQQFLKPPFGARPMTRWWWFGGAITPEEITRELETMRDAGMRGVELQPVYPLAVDNAKLGIRNTRYFSPEWFQLLRHLLTETKRLGLQFDFTPGSGWPYGGPFMPRGLSAQKLTVVSQETQGPGEFTWSLYPYLISSGMVFAVVAVPVLESGVLDTHRSVVIPRPGRRSGGAIRWTVPAGRWKILAFVNALTGQLVKRPTVGMEGHVLDHFDERALNHFLEATCEQSVQKLRSIADPPFYSIFCDSLEVFGADWTFRLMEEFKNRRGYDLTPYLPALWQDAGDVTAGVRYDYHLTLSELIVNGFFKRLQEWSHAHGMTARVQAHGAMGDVMHGYGVVDIPEGEEGEFADRYSVIINHRRLCSSAAHIYQKPVISCESYTWLREPLYLVTLEQMKGATDSSFLDGINQIVNQGYSSSPPQVGKPGWVWYASTMICENNIWWRDYKYLTAYIRHAAAVLLKGTSVNPVVVYVPLADIYSHFGVGSLVMDGEIQRRLGQELFMDLRHAGYDFDLINDDALARIAKVEDGKLKAGTAEYSVAIVPGIEHMPPESLERFAEFARQGGTLIFTERLPQTAPGLKDRETGSERLRNTLSQLFPGGSPAADTVHKTGSGKAVLASKRQGAVKYVQTAIAPDFKIVHASGSSPAALQRAVENVGFCHRKTEDTDFYFVSNISAYEQDLRIQFQVNHRSPERWNPDGGSTESVVPFRYVTTSAGPATEVEVYLKPFEACFVVFGSEAAPLLTSTNLRGPLKAERKGRRTEITGIAGANGKYFVTGPNRKTHHVSVSDLPDSVGVRGPWQLTLEGIDPFTVHKLQSWTDFSQSKHYSGWGTYETTFQLDHLPTDVEWLIDLGTVHETAEVILNGTDLGAAWKGWRRLPCGSALKQGSNQLQVKVGNLWIQKENSLPPRKYKDVADTFGIRWGLYGARHIKEVPPSGLLGPVRLLPYRSVSIAL